MPSLNSPGFFFKPRCGHGEQLLFCVEGICDPRHRRRFGPNESGGISRGVRLDLLACLLIQLTTILLSALRLSSTFKFKNSYCRTSFGLLHLFIGGKPKHPACEQVLFVEGSCKTKMGKHREGEGDINRYITKNIYYWLNNYFTQQKRV